MKCVGHGVLINLLGACDGMSCDTNTTSLSFFHSLKNNSTETERITVHKMSVLVTEHEVASLSLTDGSAASVADIVDFVQLKSEPLVDHRRKGNPYNGKMPAIVAYFRVDFGYHLAKDTRYIRYVQFQVNNNAVLRFNG